MKKAKIVIHTEIIISLKSKGNDIRDIIDDIGNTLERNGYEVENE